MGELPWQPTKFPTWKEGGLWLESLKLMMANHDTLHNRTPLVGGCDARIAGCSLIDCFERDMMYMYTYTYFHTQLSKVFFFFFSLSHHTR